MQSVIRELAVPSAGVPVLHSLCLYSYTTGTKKLVNMGHSLAGMYLAAHTAYWVRVRVKVRYQVKLHFERKLKLEIDKVQPEKTN